MNIPKKPSSICPNGPIFEKEGKYDRPTGILMPGNDTVESEGSNGKYCTPLKAITKKETTNEFGPKIFASLKTRIKNCKKTSSAKVSSVVNCELI